MNQSGPCVIHELRDSLKHVDEKVRDLWSCAEGFTGQAVTSSVGTAEWTARVQVGHSQGEALRHRCPMHAECHVAGLLGAAAVSSAAAGLLQARAGQSAARWRNDVISWPVETHTVLCLCWRSSCYV